MTENRTEVTSEIQNTKWDAIVIGSGMAGFGTANTLARNGWKVLMLEKNDNPGGYASCFKRNGFTFENSLHATTAFGHPVFTRLIREMGGLKNVKPIPLTETELMKTPLGDIPMSQQYFEILKSKFPEEAKGLAALEKVIQRINKEFIRAFIFSFFPKPIHFLFSPLVAPTIHKYHKQTLTECLSSFVKDPRLIELLGVHWVYFGCPMEKISAIAYFVAWGTTFRDGLAYIEGTSQSLSNAFVVRLEEQGGQLLLNQKVEKILLEKKRVVGVRTQGKDGKTYEFRAPVVVANVDPFQTYEKFLDPEYAPPGLLEKMHSLPLSVSNTVVYAALDCPFSEITKDKHHTYLYMNFDMAWEKLEDRSSKDLLPFRLFKSYSTIDPTLAPAGKSTLQISTIDVIKNWENLSPEERIQKEQETIQTALDTAEHYFPGLKKHIEFSEIRNPHTMQDFTGSPAGVYNGFALTPERVGMLQGGIKRRSSIPGLYLTGAWIDALSGGILGSVNNGCLTAKFIVARYGRKRKKK